MSQADHLLPRPLIVQTGNQRCYEMANTDHSQQLGDILGRGAFGSVYRALNWSSGETVAIKLISLASLPPSDRKSIKQEIDLLKNLHHPNIVKYYGSVADAETLYIILEYCENGSLHSICKNFGKFPENLVSLYTAQVLQGLLFLHEQGVIHRDIKGANILTTKEGLVKLADFGVATKTTDGSSVVGTPYWMAPEVIELTGASTASDIWSLGCTVIELLDGKPPYHKLAPMPALFRIVNDDHPPLPEGVSPLVRDFLMQCFQKDPNLRVSAKKLLKHPWILGGRKEGLVGVGGKGGGAVKHEEAVNLVEEWNAALKSSPREGKDGQSGSRRVSARGVTSRPSSRSNVGDAKAANRSIYQLGPKKERPALAPTSSAPAITAKMFSSADTYSEDEKEGGDNWDADYESLSTRLTALQLPEHRRPQSTTAADKSRRHVAAHSLPDMMDGKVETWDGDFADDGPETVRSPVQLQGANGLAAWSEEPRKSKTPAMGLAPKKRSEEQERKGSRDSAILSQPCTQILRPSSGGQSKAQASKPSKPTTVAAKKINLTTPAPAPSTTSSKQPKQYREDEDEDYSDLIPNDEAAFQRKLAGFSPSRAYNPRDLTHIQTKLGGSSARRRTHTPTNLVHDAAAMKRTRSSVEIQKYAEGEADEEIADTDFDFGEDETEGLMQLLPTKQRSPMSASVGSSSGTGRSSKTGSQRGTLKLMGWVGLEDEEGEEDDPFAAMEEELDAVDLESNVARDKQARLCTLVEGLVCDLKLSQTEDVLAEIVEQLMQVLCESPEVKSVIVSSHGMLPILEILETCRQPTTILSLLRIVNYIMDGNVEVQENLCFVGGIPIVTQFAHKKFSMEIRLEAAAFVRSMYSTSTLTLQMFVSCGGLNVLVEFLEEDYDSDAGRELVLLGVNGVWSVFELQGPTPKNDFCRIFSRSSVLYPLSLVLSRILDEEGDMAEVFEGRIVNIFLLFSQAENHVKETVADRMVLKRVLKDLKRMSPQHQVTMLKFIKNLSMLATTLDALQNSNAIEVLTDLLGASMKAPHFRDVSNQVLNTMYNLCRLSKARQEDAALNGLVPLLQRIVHTERPLKEFALPILCDMAHSGKVGRMVLWQNKGLAFYVSLLADQYWAVTALDAIFIWLQEETHKVETQLLATPAFGEAVVSCFHDSKADAFENLLEPLQKLLRLSRGVAACLGEKRALFDRCKSKMVSARKPLVRLNLLRILRSICEAHEEQGQLLRRYGLVDVVHDLYRTDSAILVREMAKSLLELVDKEPAAMRFPPGMRRSSSSTITPPPIPVTASLPPTPVAERASSRNSGFFDYGMEISRSRAPVAASSPFRPASRDASSSSMSSVGFAPPVAPMAKHVRTPGSRNSMANVRPQQSRLSMATGARQGMAAVAEKSSQQEGLGLQDDTPVRAAPPSAHTRSSAAMANARRRRQTSGAEFGR